MAGDRSDQERAYTLLELGDELIHARALQIAAELRIADLLASGPRPCEDLAERTDTDPEALHRVMRLLASRGLFHETGTGVFELTPMGDPLRSDHPASVRSVLALTGTVAPVVLGGVHHSLRTGEATFPAVTGEHVYEHMARHPEQGRLFDEAMRDLTHLVVPAVLDVYDFTGAPRIIDVGGGSGALLSAILHREPAASGILFEAPGVADSARDRIREEGLADRCSVVGGDFFREVPAGGDLYLLKWVLHNWSDERATDILRNCRRSMSEDSKLLLIESVLPAGDDPHPGKAMDLAMLVLHGGRERTEEQFTELLAGAGLRLERVVPTRSPHSLVEASPIEVAQR
ncbi:methyltransferase [Nocardiopsis sp. JB363]|uniref:methyltransferase n=1 Tax=Nocardiopsis sp. JB363 TaxID=1434837 RepID=UPI000979E189|nr:methyltransferase [Nocardiopsis sp. JB363]SIO90331.1 O-methyltransferase [Nocardiopsis sp. JB363]